MWGRLVPWWTHILINQDILWKSVTNGFIILVHWGNKCQTKIKTSTVSNLILKRIKQERLTSRENICNLHARNKWDLVNMLQTRVGWSVGNIQCLIHTGSKEPQVRVQRLCPIIWYVQIWKHTMNVHTCFLTCKTFCS